MRLPSWLMAGGLLFATCAQAQLAASDAYPINAAAPDPPLLHFEKKNRSVEVEVIVGADGHTVATRLLKRSGNGVYDERARGFWKDQPFVPAVDAQGRPRESTIRVRNSYSARPMSHGTDPVTAGERYHSTAEVIGQDAGVMASRIERMTCRDLLWEYDFMHGLAPKAALQHEEVFNVAFAMLIAAKHLGTEARDSLIAQWSTLIEQTLDSCRAQPGSAYWKNAFVHTFESATPVGVNVP